MADIVQFYKGESIAIPVRAEDGQPLEEAILLMYPDGLDLTNAANQRYVIEAREPELVDGAYVFSVDADRTLTDVMVGGYTVEVYYGSRTIVRVNRAFILVDSGYSLMQL